MAAWSILLLIVVIILVYIVVSKIYYEHKIKTGRRNLAGKVTFFMAKIQWTHTHTHNNFIYSNQNIETTKIYVNFIVSAFEQCKQKKNYFPPKMRVPTKKYLSVNG